MKSIKGLLVLLTALTAFLAGPVFATDYPPFQPSLPVGATCEIPLRSLHPTQFCVGEREVQQRASKLAAMKDKKLEAYLDKHLVPVVIGPGGFAYVVDHHHLARAVLESGVRSAVPVQILANWSDLDRPTFWRRMQDKKWVHPYRRGQGPLNIDSLPATIGEMTDDPYRSLVWAARHTGPEDDRDETPYADFKWADYFRTRIELTGTDSNFAAATLQAAALMKGQ